MRQKKPFQKTKLAIYAGIILCIAYFFTKNSLDVSKLILIEWSGKLGLAIFLALTMLFLRDLGYVLRIRLLTERKIGWARAIRIILLWEFGSAITPGMIGGKAVAIYMLIKSKIHAAKASSIVLLSILLDEFIFILVFPIFYSYMGSRMLHGNTLCPDWIELTHKIPYLSNIHYLENIIFIMLAIILAFVLIAFIGIFLYPYWLRSLCYALSRIQVFSRWKESIRGFGNEILDISENYKAKSIFFWLELVAYTLLSWLGRYLVGVAIVWGFSSIQFSFLEAYAKQYALWLMFYVPSTPGSSGIAEALYMAFYCEYIMSGMAGTAAFIWRTISYYIYLIVGFILIFYRGEKEIIEES